MFDHWIFFVHFYETLIIMTMQLVDVILSAGVPIIVFLIVQKAFLE